MGLSQEKKAAALAALQLVQDRSILGLGSGSTMEFFTGCLAKKIIERNLDIKAVATSYQVRFLAYKCKIPLLDIHNIDRIDLTVDGADEIDPKGDLIKGKGGAHLIEKIVASLSERFVIIADQSKIVKTLGVNSPVPIEVIPPAIRLVQRKLTVLGALTSIRAAAGKVGPVVTDSGNIILDAKFVEINDAQKLSYELNNIPGIAGHGLFVNLAQQAFVGYSEGNTIDVKTIVFKKS